MEMAVPLSDDGREALDGATHKVSESFVQHRYSAVPMECRAVTARWEPFDQRLDVWHASQNPHEARLVFSRATGVPENNVRVQIGDVGGGFGLKSFVGPRRDHRRHGRAHAQRARSSGPRTDARTSSRRRTRARSASTRP